MFRIEHTAIDAPCNRKVWIIYSWGIQTKEEAERQKVDAEAKHQRERMQGSRLIEWRIVKE